MPPAEPSRNLLIVHAPLRQDIADWISVKATIEQRAPDIEVRIATSKARQPVTARWQVSRPSLVFSPFALEEYRPRGGAVFCGRNIGKLAQAERLAAHGVPAPKTAPLTRELAADAAAWGEYVIVKPDIGHQGKLVRLVRTADLPARYDELTRDPMRPMLVQTFIPHTEDGYQTHYRVLTLFGQALYCARSRWAQTLGPLDAIAADPNGIIASNDASMGGRVYATCIDPAAIALAEKAHAEAFPEYPLLGVDVVRDASSGTLFVIEMNPSGDTWAFSSAYGRQVLSAAVIRDMYDQFGALDRTADILIERTRALAS